MRWAFLAFVVLAAATCNLYTPDLLGKDAGSLPEAGAGFGWWSGYDGTCLSVGAPRASDRPGARTSDSSLPPIYLAIRTLRLGSLDLDNQLSQTAWQDIGLDLDGVCTSSPTCATDNPIVSCKPTMSAVPYDGNHCRDNTFGRLEVQAATIPELGGKYGLNDDAFNCGLCTGAYNFIIRITGYNGTANDDKVRLDFYPSPGLETVLPWSCKSGDWRIHPCFMPDSPWLIRDTAVTQPRGGPDLPDAVLADDAAYVRDGYLVAQLPPNALIWFPSIKGRKDDVAAAFPLTFSSGVIVGRLHKGQDGTWTVDDGTIGGRSRESDIIKGFRLIGFCESDPNYGLMLGFLHANLDILSSGANDPNTTCDAISVGIGFTATQAVAGKLAHVDDLVECATSADGGIEGGTDAGMDAGVMDAGADAPPDAKNQ